MTVIARDIFQLAMDLMDEESENGTFSGYPTEYKNKAWSILTILQSELLPPSVSPLAVTSEATVMQIDDRTSVTTLPYGLAAQLLLTEDQNKAAFFNARYDELKRKRPATIVSIKDVYGVKAFTENELIDHPLDELEPIPTTSDIEGSSFLNPKSGTYDGGEF